MKNSGIALSLLLAVACSKTEAAGVKPDPKIKGAIASAALQSTPQQPDNVAIGAALSDRVREAILADRSLSSDAGTVQVTTKDGVVTLTGSVRSPEIQERMGIVARAVGSVVRVDNRLVVEPNAAAGEITMETTVERAISDRVRLALQNDSTLATEEPSIGITTKQNVVTLRGFVSSAAAKERASVLAKAVGSVDRVDNRLQVRGE